MYLSAILFVGVCIVQLPQEALTGEKGIFSNFTETSNFKGLIFILMACFTSAFAGVYFEKLLKTSKTSVWIRNIQLGMYSFLFGGIGSYYYDQEAISEHGFLQVSKYLESSDKIFQFEKQLKTAFATPYD